MKRTDARVTAWRVLALVLALLVLVQARNILQPAIQASDPSTNAGMILMRNAFINTRTGTEEPVPFSTGVTPQAIINSQPAWTTEVEPARATRQQYLVHVQDASVDTVFLLNLVMGDEGKILEYIPHNTYLMMGTEKAAAALTPDYGVDWVGEYSPHYKLANEIFSNPTVQSDEPDASYEMIATLTVDAEWSMAEAVKIAAEWQSQLQAHGIPVTVTAAALNRLSISCTVEGVNPIVAFAAQQPQTQWIEPVLPDELANNYAAETSQSDTWDLASIWNKGLHGEGEIVGCADTGLDYDHCHFWDRNQPAPTSTINLNHRKIVGYNSYADSVDEVAGHGTHVAGSIVAQASSTVAAEQAYAQQFNGVAYGAKMVFFDIGIPGALRTPSNLYTGMLPYMYNAGARIESHSWGSTGVNSYNYRCQDIDKFSYEKKDFLLLQAAGNDGHTTSGTLIAPAAAKDVVTVGSHLHSPAAWKFYCCSTGKPSCCTNAAYDCTTSCGAVTKGNGARPTTLSSFTSAGPTDDGRFMPTITAPGQKIFSSYSDGDPKTFQCGTSVGKTVVSKQGTSMATPVAAGHAALIRQYFREGWYPTGVKTAANKMMPSASLIKAMLVNSAVVLTGEGTVVPSNSQGYGRIELDNVLKFSDSTFSLWVDNDVSISKGQTRTSCVNAKAGTTLKITLVWTDPPGTLSAAIILVNNLDLKVTDTKGAVIWGNSAANGPKADTLNNVEHVTIPNAAAGKYTISVIGTSVPQGPQLYSLVITGNFDYNPSCTNPGTVDPTPTDPNPGGPPVVIEPVVPYCCTTPHLMRVCRC